MCGNPFGRHAPLKQYMRCGTQWFQTPFCTFFGISPYSDDEGERDRLFPLRGITSIQSKGEIELKDLLDTFAVCGQLMEDTDPCGCNHTNECSEFAPFPLPSFPEDYAVAMAPINRMQKAMMRKRRLRAALSFRCSTSRFWGKRGAAAYDAKRKTAPAPELRSVCALGASPIPGYPSKRYAGARYGQTIRQYGFLTR